MQRLGGRLSKQETLRLRMKGSCLELDHDSGLTLAKELGLALEGLSWELLEGLVLSETE